jgi:uncharacterized protein YxeA
MKNYIFSILLLTLSFIGKAQTYNSNSYYQQGYYRQSTGTQVNGHFKTQSNNTNWDNYSTQGNTNPYTNQSGTRARDYSTESDNYGSGQTIYEGPKGGQYYINSNGNKTYVPKRRSGF